MKKLLKDILTGANNKTFDNGRVLGFIVVMSYLFFTLYDVVMTHTFEYEQFGIGITAIFTGIGFNLKLKETSEPDK